MGQLLAGLSRVRRGMSPHSGVSQVPRLRAETHFGVQARALPVGLHRAGGLRGMEIGKLYRVKEIEGSAER